MTRSTSQFAELTLRVHRDRISTTSKLPGGSMLHRVIAKAVAARSAGVLEQAQDESRTSRPRSRCS